MATIVFVLQSTSENSQIYVRVSEGNEIKLKRKTGLTINAQNWNLIKTKNKELEEKNKNLELDVIKIELEMKELLNRLNLIESKLNKN